jgi:hypothetical protein
VSVAFRERIQQSIARARPRAELVFLLANRTWLTRTGRTYERFVASTHPLVRRIGRWLVPSPEDERIP